MLRLHGEPGSSRSGCCRSPRSGSQARPCRPGASPARAAAATTEVTVVRAGYGDIRVEGAGGKLVLTCTSELDAKDEKIGCTFSVPTGTALDVQSDPEACRSASAARRVPTRLSSRSSSAGAGRSARPRRPCTVKTAADQEWVVAQFSPVWLEALVTGAGHGRRRRQQSNLRRFDASWSWACSSPASR